MENGENMLIIKSDTECLFCKRTPDREDRPFLHLFYKLGFFGVHRLCVVTSTFIQAYKNTQHGLFGFDYECIARAFEKTMEIYCTFCHRKNASIICDDCEKPFHLPCGIKNNCVVEMCGSHVARCEECFRKNNDGKAVLPDRLKKYFRCSLCRQDYSNDNGIVYRSECCSRTNCHLRCLRMMAFALGPNTRCPRCLNKDHFQKRIRKLGVNIPEFAPPEQHLNQEYVSLIQPRQ